MDISKFNSLLKEKITRARLYENKEEIEKAVDAWIDVSELVLRFSKVKSLDVSYRSMLIRKAEDIIKHIKSLKEKVSPIQVSSIKEEDLGLDLENPPFFNDASNRLDDTLDLKKSVNVQPNESNDQEGITSPENVKIKEKSEFPNLPKGFVEIEPPKDFKIITPHDRDFIKKLISPDDMDEEINQTPIESTKNNINFTPKGNIMQKTKNIESLTCFACGGKISPKDQKCPNCGIKLK